MVTVLVMAALVGMRTWIAILLDRDSGSWCQPTPCRQLVVRTGGPHPKARSSLAKRLTRARPQTVRVPRRR